jgi:SpoVK/Ycf46/Vps4 family AAA+-type ATPase
VLFFDEADSLFGKRSEVTDARDRYANLEVSYLLQRLEAYDGMVILATNFSKNLDDAFLRRIHVSIEFPMPAEPERKAIWQHAIPKAAPVKDIDYDFLARQFDLAGGSIKGAALHAAFLAADAGQPITMELLMMALKREFQKLGRLRTQNEFGQYTKLVNS